MDEKTNQLPLVDLEIATPVFLNLFNSCMDVVIPAIH